MLPVKPFIDFIKQNNLLDNDNQIVVAVSGGMDSVLLAHLLKASGFNFCIAHCNFQLRGNESENDQQFCNQLAQQLNVPFYTTRFDTLTFAEKEKISIQMAARQLRYQWFEQIRQLTGSAAIALAHHQNDGIETILLNLVRGTGIAGLHGILPKNGLLVRPLLYLKREEIERIVIENKLTFVEDSSNASVKYARNKIRLEVVPKLRELNPALEHTFENNLKHFRDLELLLNKRVAEIRDELFIPYGDEIHLLIEKVRQIDPIRLVLFNLLTDFGFNETVVGDLIDSLNKHPGRIFESAGYRLILDRDRLILKKKGNTPPEQVSINKTDSGVNYGRYKTTIYHDHAPLIVKDNPMKVAFDSDALIYPLTIRSWEEGDYFYPIGMVGRKKVSDFFINQKLPLHKKNEIPLLINGNGDIIWIGGYRPDERFKVTDKTKKVTIFELTF